MGSVPGRHSTEIWNSKQEEKFGVRRVEILRVAKLQGLDVMRSGPFVI